MRPPFKLLLGLALIALQAAIVALGLFFPRVDATYRAYFIDQTLETWPGDPGSKPMTGLGRPLRDSEIGPYQK